MSVNSIQAAQAYLQAAQSAGITNTGPTQNIAQTNLSAGFSSLVQDVIAQTQNNLGTADNASSTVATGEANLVEVVTAISAAEVSLETAIAVRNRMIEAYQEIMRMPI